MRPRQPIDSAGSSESASRQCASIPICHAGWIHIDRNANTQGIMNRSTF
jgi:hypothetical protein